MSESTSVSIPPEFRNCAASAIVRLSARHPEAEFHLEAGAIQIAAANEALPDLRRALLHALYRERILERTLAVRMAVIGAGR